MRKQSFTEAPETLKKNEVHRHNKTGKVKFQETKLMGI